MTDLQLGDMRQRFRAIAAIAIVLAVPACGLAQTEGDTRTQYPAALRDSFVGFSLGGVDQRFSEQLAGDALRVTSVDVPPLAARVTLFGHEFSRYWSAQLTYLRPVTYIAYLDENGERHHVRVNFGTATIIARAPIHRRWSLYGEGGLAITSRTGFRAGDRPAVPDAHYASVVLGSGLEYRIAPAWDVTGGLTYIPGRASVNEARTLFAAAGLRYTLRPISRQRVLTNRRTGYTFPEHLAQIEYSTGIGYGVNDFVSRTVPVFWGGHADVDGGVAVHYEQNVFHTRKVFALDFGTSGGVYRTRRRHERFATLSVYPLLRFTVLRRRPADLYVSYSLAGPSYISRTVLDGLDTGHHFTFQDFMGVGLFAGRRRSFTLGVKINHYSNGNIFTQNAGVRIPLTITVGRTF